MPQARDITINCGQTRLIKTIPVLENYVLKKNSFPVHFDIVFIVSYSTHIQIFHKIITCSKIYKCLLCLEYKYLVHKFNKIYKLYLF